MSFSEKPIIRNSAEIIKLIAERTPEDIVTEFKRELPADTNEAKRETLKDLSSFLNTLGGSVFYGISEVNSRADAICPLSQAQVDKFIGRMNQSLRTSLDPSAAVEFVSHDVPGHGLVLEARCKASPSRPHMVKLQHDRFWARKDNGKFLMGVVELRNSFTAFNPAKTVYTEEYIKVSDLFSSRGHRISNKNFDRCILDGPCLFTIRGDNNSMIETDFAFCEAVIIRPEVNIKNIVYLNGVNFRRCELRSLTMLYLPDEFLDMPANLQTGINVISGHAELEAARIRRSSI